MQYKFNEFINNMKYIGWLEEIPSGDFAALVDPHGTIYFINTNKRDDPQKRIVVNGEVGEEK